MADRFWVLFVVIVLAATLAHADKGGTATVDAPAPPEPFKEPATGMELVYVKGGCYEMGDIFDDEEALPEEKPVHEVCVDDFYIGKYEVTVGQWKSVMGTNPSLAVLDISKCGADNCPVSNVSWTDVQEFITKLNSKGGGTKYRLPTEAEWEYAARSGGKREMFSGGNNAGKVAWYAENSGDKLHPVGTKAPNGLGAYDMSGNVWEMTNDWYRGDYYKTSPRNNPQGPSSGKDRVIRGGCSTGGPWNMRTARRSSMSEHMGDESTSWGLGFRLVRTP